MAGGESLEMKESLRNLEEHKLMVRILVVGLTGHGKSSLINKMVGEEVAAVEHGASACGHKEKITEYKLSMNDKTLLIYDTKGLGDIKVSEKGIFKAVRSKLKEVDLMLICHRLYDRAEGATERMLQQVMSQCGKDLLNRSVLCYTRADEYKVNDNPITVQKNSLTAAIKPILTRHTLTEEEFDAIPICLTSTRVQDLPTAPNWSDTFWESCLSHCTKGARPFLRWYIRYKLEMRKNGGLTGSMVGGVATGTAIGAVVGTGLIPIPGVGTAIGASIGAATGLVGSAVGGVLGVDKGVAVAKTTKKVPRNEGKEDQQHLLSENAEN